MAIALKRTGATNQYINCLIYGQSGSGKTTLCGTIDNIVVLSAEGGLLSLADKEIDYLEIKCIDDLHEAYAWLKSEDSMKFSTVALDSISEIAEVVLSNEKEKVKDARQAYMQLGETMNKIVRSFRDLEKNTVFIAKAEKIQDENGRILWGPSMPGAKLASSMPYYFDEVLAMRCEKNEEGQTVRMLQTENDGTWNCKDRSGKLSQWEAPDLNGIIGKIKNV